MVVIRPLDGNDYLDQVATENHNAVFTVHSGLAAMGLIQFEVFQAVMRIVDMCRGDQQHLSALSKIIG